MAATRRMTSRTAASKAETSEQKQEFVKPEPKREAPKKYRDDDRIPCCSITVGEYLFEGDKSHELYDWVADGDIVNMRADDLIMAIRTRKPCVFKPRIIIQDDDFLASFPEVQQLYDTLYSKDNLMAILALEPKRMTDVIQQMPEGAKDAIKGMAMKAIEDGSFDSVARVRALDQLFGTDMLLKLAQ